MDNSTSNLQRIQEALNRAKTIAVAVKANPSIDDMGAALGLYLALFQMGKNVSIVCPTEPIVELSNLVGIDKVKTSFQGEGADLIVSFPYKEGEIDKVSYTIENEFLNIVVKAGEQGLNFTETDVKYTRGGNGGSLDLLFTIGTTKLSQIHSIFASDVLKNVTIVNIDNKQENDGFGDIVLVFPGMSSLSEHMTQLLSDLRSPVDTDIAQNLLDGIINATDSFKSSKTTYLAFEMAGILMRQGAIRRNISRVLHSDDLTFRSTNQEKIQQSNQKPIIRESDDRRSDFNPRGQVQNSRGNQSIQRQSAPQQIINQPLKQQINQQNSQNRNEPDDLNPPTDWLAPKVYKGSSNV